MAEHADVLILGGGVIGLSTAYYLAGAGATVAVLDRADFGQQASWAGAGIITPCDARHAHTPFDQLRAHSGALYPVLSRQLAEETGIDNGYCVCGGVELSEPDDSCPTPGCEDSTIPVPGSEDSTGLPTEEWAGAGIAFEQLDHPGLLRHLPDLASRFTRGAFLPQMAQVRNPRHLQALQAACRLRGVQLYPHCPAHTLLQSGQRVEAVETGQGRLTAGSFLVATGAWADTLLEQAGWRPGIRPVRGQIALLNTGREGVRPVVMVGKRYLVPRTDGRLLVGSTEEDAGFDARPTAGAIAGLLSFAAGLFPALADAPLERCWAGLRPGSPDGLPFLGPVPGWDNLFVAAGHFRSGLQLSPITGLVMSQLLLGRPTTVDLYAFRLDRAGALPAQTAFRS
jgi:glycine oxidase